MWNVWLDGEALETFREKSFYSVLNAQHNVKVIALDTVACDSLNFYNIRDPEDPNGQVKKSLDLSILNALARMVERRTL